MSAAVGGLIGCGLLTLVVIIVIIVITSLAGNNASSTSGTPQESSSVVEQSTSAALAESEFPPTLDPTSAAARNALLPTGIPGSPSATPGIVPVGVRPTATLDAAISAIGGSLVYFAEREANFDLFKLNLRSGVETRLTTDSGAESYAAVSPDGKWIAFQSNRDGDWDIYVMPTDCDTLPGGCEANIHAVTHNMIFDRLPAWSPDGEWIVFSSDTRNDGNFDLYRIRPDGSDLQQVFSNESRNSHARYSPAAPYLIFTTGDSKDGATWDIGRLNTQTQDFTILTGGSKDWSPSFSPDGQHILYLVDQEGVQGDAAIALMDADGQNPRILYDGAGFEWGASYSPDGAYIAFTASPTSSGTDQGDIFIMRADGTGIEQVTHQGGQYAVWVPGG